MKIKGIFSSFLVFFIIILSFAACSNGQNTASTVSAADYPVTVEGTNITAAPKKIAVLSDAHASAIVALGKEALIVGAPFEFVSKGYSNITDIGYSSNPDMEAIFSLAPDLLILPGGLFHTDANNSFLKGLTQRGIAYVSIAVPQKYDDIQPFYESIAKILFGNTKYKEPFENHVKSVNDAMDNLRASNKALNKRVIVFTDKNGFVVSGDMLAGEALKKAGINNIANNSVSEMMSFSDIAKADPEVIFCPKGTGDAFLKNEALKETVAVKNAAVYEIDAEELLFAGKDFAAVLQDMSTFLK